MRTPEDEIGNGTILTLICFYVSLCARDIEFIENDILDANAGPSSRPTHGLPELRETQDSAAASEHFAQDIQKQDREHCKKDTLTSPHIPNDQLPHPTPDNPSLWRVRVQVSYYELVFLVSIFTNFYSAVLSGIP